MKIYGHPISGPARFIFGLCKHLEIGYEPHIVDLTKGEQFAEDYNKVNPNSKVPCIVEEDGFTLFESAAIARYLIDTKVGESSLYPKDPKTRAQIDKVTAEIGELRGPGLAIVTARFVFPKLGKTFPPALL